MNISQPTNSCIGSVDFGFLSSEEIKGLSVKRILNPLTFDTLLHPLPGGLYDSALGAWADNPCSTCHLNTYNCPGHIGHIELPVPVYHPVFINQLLILLRAKCAYCSHLKLHPAEVNRFICKLRLISYGLIDEVENLENIRVNIKETRDECVNAHISEDGEQYSDPGDMTQDLQRRRNDFVRRAIKKQDDRRRLEGLDTAKVEAIFESRKGIIKEFFTASTNTKTCGTCKGISPTWRKHGSNKIFRKPLAKKVKAKMVQEGFRAVNPLVRAVNDRKALTKQKREERDLDEGIVVDSEDLISEEEGQEIEMLDVENEGQPSSLLEEPAVLDKAKSNKDDNRPDQFVNPQEIHATITELFSQEKEILELVYGHHSKRNLHSLNADMFFIKTVIVPPNRFRPEVRSGDGGIVEAIEHQQYKNILSQCERIHKIRNTLVEPENEPTQREGTFRDLQNSWVALQDAVNSMIDSDRNPVQGAASRQNVDGIKQKLEKKEGLFRKHMMGKRVNFAARSVISPDPNIETNEIGVPPVFARKLTFPEPVTNHNFYEMKEAVLNGVEKWPGASAIENESGQVINLRTKNFEERQALANQLLAPSSTNVNGARNKKVHRHLTNGDIVLMNRQPTLHKPSIMAHRTRILPGEKTIRMHYANCNAYNADFDGDEMNMHFPQNEVARAEALQIADTDHQYLVATSGKPLRGLIQDHISMGVWLTNKDTFFDQEDYHQLLCSCLRPEREHTNSHKIQTVAPTIVKPHALWTGKQIITSVLKNITPLTHPGLGLRSKSQTASDRWGEGSEEGNVIFHRGALLCGILDKAQLGPSAGGFVHAVYEAFGHTIAGRLLSILGRLLTKLLHMRAFTCGIDDLQLTMTGDGARRETLKRAETIGLEVASNYVTLERTPDTNSEELRSRLQDVLRDEKKHAGLDDNYKTKTSQLSTDITLACLPIGLAKPFPWNQMQAMTTSGAKGTPVNANLISCNLGQQVLEGRRVPVMVSGKTLPSFQPFETNVRAGGYITDRFLTGVRPQEYYFHAMAGREGLIDTAVKTSRSGYLQRCLIKGMEGLRSEYDTTVRDSDGSMIQFLYGEDGLDVTKQKHLTDFPFLAENYLSLVAQLNIREEFGKLKDVGATGYHKSAMKRYRKTARLDCLDPALALYNPGSSIGATSENFASALKSYCEKNPDRLLRDKNKAPDADLTRKTFAALMDVKYLKSTIEPGEAVGVVAGQSIGEPSTQMTLNTFHLAGHAARNVTLGIPRLREIVMTASKVISTPTMTLHLIPELTEEAGQRFAKGITKLTMAEVIQNVSVEDTIGKGVGYPKARIYNVRLNLYPAAEYCEIYAITIADVLKTLEAKFVPGLARSIKRELVKKGDAKLLKPSAAHPEIGKSSGKDKLASGNLSVELEGGEDDLGDIEEDNDDATNSKQRQNRQAAISYQGPDDEEAAIAKQAKRETTPASDDDDYDDVDSAIGGSPDPVTSQPTHARRAVCGSDDEEVAMQKSTAESRETRIKQNSPSVTHFTFDAKGSKWCDIQLEYDISTAKLLLLPLVEAACHDAVIQSIPPLGACAYTEEKVRNAETKAMEVVPVVLTQGVNFRAMHDYQDILNPHRMFTNDIWQMMQVYGVEAGRATIIREMDAVFKGHGITVDTRHLNLIAEFMTRGGAFKPYSRLGLASSVSPLQKASFETTLGFLRDAVLDGDWDDLQNPSARLVTGKLSGVGTGAFDVLIPMEH
ncbi:MAG: hypothetical protein Q9163_003098 [Psora crenata]